MGGTIGEVAEVLTLKLSISDGGDVDEEAGARTFRGERRPLFRAVGTGEFYISIAPCNRSPGPGDL